MTLEFEDVSGITVIQASLAGVHGAPNTDWSSRTDISYLLCDLRHFVRWGGKSESEHPSCRKGCFE